MVQRKKNNNRSGLPEHKRTQAGNKHFSGFGTFAAIIRQFFEKKKEGKSCAEQTDGNSPSLPIFKIGE